MYANSDFLCTRKHEYYTKKKSFSYCEKSEEKRAEYTAKLKRVPPAKRIYLDESGVNTYLQREYARAPRGEVIEDVKPGKRFERVNVIGALCNDNYIGIECYQHTSDSAFFESWFEDHFLNNFPKGYTVIMDNARFHRKKELRKMARGKVRLLFLPPYSPDFNPIEKTWANMKRHLKNNMIHFQSVNSAIYNYFEIIKN